jgi:16S rRNA (uracil1498-N3)-methyltransferase
LDSAIIGAGDSRLRRRFFVPQFEGNSVSLQGDAAQHLGKVLRSEPGQLYELSDGRHVWLGRVERVARDRVEFALVEKLPAREPRLQLSLLLAIIKFDCFEWAIEKATELGASEIAPLAAARSEKALIAAAPKRAARWEKILLEAAQQSRRLRPPVLRALAPPQEAFAQATSLGKQPGQKPLLIFCAEDAAAPPLREVLAERARETTRQATLAIGPEGGWTPEEAAGARAAGFAEASLGPQILRTETAVIAALAAFHYALGD